MAEQKYLTAPDPNETGWPRGVRYIIGNEGCERFSFYGMKSILQIHLTSLFVLAAINEQASIEQAAEEHAQEMVHLFVAGVYAFPMIGAIIADRLLGKYRTILWLSLVYCFGHLVLAIGENSITGMWIGLGLIAVGSGGIKPCVSAHVGDQFGTGNWNLVGKVFQAFYFIINFGSFFATLMIPWVNEYFGTSVAFGIPGVLMFIATIMFWMGRKVFVHVPAHPGGKLGLLDAIGSTLLFMGIIGLPMFFRDLLDSYQYWGLTAGSIGGGLLLFKYRQSIERDDGFLAIIIHSVGALFSGANGRAKGELPADASEKLLQRHWFFASAAKEFGEEAAEGPRAVLRIVSIFFLVSVFWALFDQHASSWIRQAQRMDLNVNLLGWKTIEMLPSQIQALNPLMVMALIPFNNYLLYPWIEKLGLRMTPLRRMSVGMAVASLSFAVVAILQVRVQSGGTENTISVLWQFFPYLIITQAEVMVSITGLEFAYTQAPRRMKSTIMGFWLLSVSLGNVLVAVVTKAQSWLLPLFTEVDPEAGPDLAHFFWFFSGLMAVAALLFALRAAFYEYRDYTQ